jgi:hypothetical protein
MSRSTPINLFLFIAARQKRETSRDSEARNRWKALGFPWLGTSRIVRRHMQSD